MQLPEILVQEVLLRLPPAEPVSFLRPPPRHLQALAPSHLRPQLRPPITRVPPHQFPIRLGERGGDGGGGAGGGGGGDDTAHPA